MARSVKKRDIKNLEAFESALGDGKKSVELDITAKEASDIKKLSTGDYYPVIKK